MPLLFTLLVLIGFIMKFIASLPTGSPWPERLAWGLWMVAAFIWAVQRL